MKLFLEFTFFLFFIFIGCQRIENSENQLVQGHDTLGYSYQSKLAKEISCTSKTDTTDCCLVRLKYPEFDSLPIPLRDSFSLFSKQFFTWIENKPGNPDTLIQSFFHEYQAVEILNGKASLPWYLDKAMVVERQTRSWICLGIYENVFTGGAHPSQKINWITLDQKSGKRLGLIDFFDTTGIKKLTKAGEKYFREAREIKPDFSLSEAGLDFKNGEFSLNENFCFTKEGIKFIFNEYEIGPYSMGMTEFTIPANKFVKFMKIRKNP
jgi:hypothetical protein